MPIRSPVNVPGPTPTAIASRSAKPTPARSITSATAGISSAAWPGRPSSRSGAGRLSKASPSARSTHALVAEVLVSKPSSAHSMVMRRRSPPRCSRRTRAATAGGASPATSGHSMKATRSGVR